MREIIFSHYPIESILNALEQINLRIPQHLTERNFLALYEELIFMNFALSIIKKNDHTNDSGFDYKNLELGIHIPDFNTLKIVIKSFIQYSSEQHRLEDNSGSNRDEFTDMLPRLIIF